MLQAASHRCSSKPGLGGVMVSTAACTQVVQGSNPTDGWKVIWNATAFSAVAFKMILRAPVRVPVHFFLKILI